MALAALIVSVLALVVAASSLVWQVISWRRSGPQVKVETANSFPVFDEPGGRRDLGDHHVEVKAYNGGRAPVTLTAWGLQLPGGRTAISRGTAWSSPMPHRLEPGAEAGWHMSADEVRAVCAEQGVTFRQVHGFVTLAGGERVRARKPVPLG
jgi:hypothetical protein